MPKTKKSKSREPARAQARANEAPEKTREALLNAARCLFARRGIDGTTVRDLADEAGVNISLISYHFDGKEGLYRACLEQMGRERLAVAERILQTPKSLEEFRVRLQMFIEEVLGFQASDPEICQIVQRECEIGNAHSEDIFRNTFLKNFETLVQFLQAGQKAGVIRKDLDAMTAGALFFTCVMNLTRTDVVSEKFFKLTIKEPSYRKKVAEHVFSIFTDGLLAR